MMDIISILLSAGIPSAVVGLAVWQFKRSLSKKEQRDERREEARKQNEFLLVKSIRAIMALSEATALAVEQQHHTNGEMTAALRYAQEVKHEQKDFLTRQGIDHLF